MAVDNQRWRGVTRFSFSLLFLLVLWVGRPGHGRTQDMDPRGAQASEKVATGVNEVPGRDRVVPKALRQGG